MEISSPITIYWDLSAAEGETPSTGRVCADILECRPLMVQVTDPVSVLSEHTVAVLERLKGSGIAVTLTVPAASLKRGERGRLRGLELKEVLLDAERLEQVREIAGLMGAGMGISFRVTAESWRELPALVAFCGERGMRRLVLPMQHLYDGEAPFHMSREELKELGESVAFVGGGEGMEITVHDPFLWQVFNPGIPFPQGGCQAGNTMIAIAPGGRVYPCPALPVLLGRIGTSSLREIIASPAKKEFRRGLLEYPAGCMGCPELHICKGGCRGRAFAAHGSLNEPDPACG